MIGVVYIPGIELNDVIATEVQTNRMHQSLSWGNRISFWILPFFWTSILPFLYDLIRLPQIAQIWGTPGPQNAAVYGSTFRDLFAIFPAGHHLCLDPERRHGFSKIDYATLDASLCTEYLPP